MKKETFYFSHDYNASNDPEMKKLFMLLGLEGIGLYWVIVEMLYNEGGYLYLDCIETIAFNLRTDVEKIQKMFKTKLFKSDKEKFWSTRVLENLNSRNEKKAKLSEAGKLGNKIRWGKNDIATRSLPNRNLSQIKGKEKKEKKNINPPIPPFVDEVVGDGCVVEPDQVVPLEQQDIIVDDPCNNTVNIIQGGGVVAPSIEEENILTNEEWAEFQKFMRSEKFLFENFSSRHMEELHGQLETIPEGITKETWLSWCRSSVQIAADNNVRTWSYLQGIIKRTRATRASPSHKIDQVEKSQQENEYWKEKGYWEKRAEEQRQYEQELLAKARDISTS